MSIKRKRRGISFGTIFMLSLCVVTLLFGALVFTRIAGDTARISLDPNLLTESLRVLARSVTDVITESGTPFPVNEAPTPAVTRQIAAPPSTAAPTAALTAAPAPTQPPSRTLTLTAAGQVSIGTELRSSASKAAGGFDFYDMVSPVAHALSGANLSIVTLRTGLAGANATGFDTYCAPAWLVDGLKASGLNLFNFATDRVLDHGVRGIGDTRSVMDSKNTYFAGIYRTQEERSRPAVVDMGGVKVGLLAYTSSLSAAGKKAATEQEAALYTRYLSAQAAAAEITALRVNGADVVIVLPCWGGRADTKPSKETRAEADVLIEAGADIILGTGPTSVHELERRAVTDAYGEVREVFIAYSLGNFLIDDSRDTANILGMILSLDITWDTQTRKTSIGEAWYMPTWIMRWRDASGVNRYRVIPAGVSTIPEGMTESIYINMKKAYQNMVERLGKEAARARGE
ncbi:MAG: CapA family protein [Firmicutes bacterium]|nr:CapA family protein [Bacillota bacterium]